MSGVEVTAEAQATLADLSAAAVRFLEHVRQDPDGERPLPRGCMPPRVQSYGYPFQAWPTFVDRRKLHEMRRVTLAVTRLVKAVPERIFGNDAGRIGRYYGLSELMVDLVLAPPNGIAGALARCDLFDTGADGFKCVEVNLSANLGGWQVHLWGDAYCKTPVVARFLAAHGVAARVVDPVRSMVEHVVAESLGHAASGSGELNLALVVDEFKVREPGMVQEALSSLYASVLRQYGGGLSGSLFLTTYQGGFAARGQSLSLGRAPVQAVVEYTVDVTPPDVFRCFKSGAIQLYNGPVFTILGDKRNLALLSLHEDSDLFDAAERALIRAHVPWSRETTSEMVTYRGEKTALQKLLLARQEDFVIKLATGARGEDVFVGRSTDPGIWRQQVQRTASAPGWLAQEAVRSRPYVFQRGEQGSALHDVVWGLFSFGGTYGGGFLRMMPAGSGDGIINSARGASEGIIVEV